MIPRARVSRADAMGAVRAGGEDSREPVGWPLFVAVILLTVLLALAAQ